jgi:transcriptional regulator with XRE-family HTH domain
VDDERPEWALWLQQQRHERNWSLRRLARELRQRADKRGWRLPSDEDLIRMMRRWERGEHKPDERYRELLAEVYDDSAPDELQPESILDDMQRRPFLRGLGAFMGLAAASTLRGAMGTAVASPEAPKPRRPGDGRQPCEPHGHVGEPGVPRQPSGAPRPSRGPLEQCRNAARRLTDAASAALLDRG